MNFLSLLQSRCYNLYVYFIFFPLHYYNLSYYITELYRILIHHRTMPFFNTLTRYIIELNPMLKYCRTILSPIIRSQQYPRASKLTAGVIINPRRKNYTLGSEHPRKKNIFLEKVHSAENESLNAFHNLTHCKTL